jgi:catechol 2,3-dioxygenase-like lactoylglutathione lyase family enzyme
MTHISCRVRDGVQPLDKALDHYARRAIRLCPLHGEESMTRISGDRKEFRFTYFTAAYDDTVAFYRDGLGLPILDCWDREGDDRGTAFGVASGMIEVLDRPASPDAEHLFDPRPPQGAFMVIEIDDVDGFHDRLAARGLPIERGVQDQSWGHRSLLIREPNGLVLYFFSEL